MIKQKQRVFETVAMTDNSVTTCDTALRALKAARRSTGMPWRKIAALDEYFPIPAGTLCRWHNTGYLPKKWYHKLGIEEPTLVYPCKKCGIVHPVTKRCPHSADSQRKRSLRPPATEIRKGKDDAAIAAAQIGRNCHFKVTDLIVELSKQLPEETVKELKERL